MSQVFFSVDVETTSTNPFTGELLSVGIVPISGETLQLQEGKHWALEYNPRNVNKETVEWWLTQNSEAYTAAWKGIRTPEVQAAQEISDYILSFSDERHDRVFCANPVSFDWPWVDKLFAKTQIPNPFSHRTLCMRSFLYGKEGGVWGQSRYKNEGFHAPKVPHHALHDAVAQAKDFVDMVQGREQVA